jgi:hypothetical protein
MAYPFPAPVPASTSVSAPASVSALDAGRICAVATVGARDLQHRVASHPDLFPAGPFDPTLCAAVALANAFSAPWLDAAGLRAANRSALWAFGVDRLVDVAATSRRQVTAMGARCRAVARGAAASDGVGVGAGDRDLRDEGPGGLGGVGLGAFLAEIRDDLRSAPGYARLAPTWRRELSRMLAAMAREFGWRQGGARPSVAEYLDNADNLGLTFVFASHLVHTAGRVTGSDVIALVAAARAAQRAVRLVNDLATYERDLATGDLNVLRLGVTRREVERLLGALVARCREDLGRFGDTHPYPAEYLRRQVEFNLGFHPLVDYWAGSAANPGGPD